MRTLESIRSRVRTALETTPPGEFYRLPHILGREWHMDLKTQERLSSQASLRADVAGQLRGYADEAQDALEDENRDRQIIAERLVDKIRELAELLSGDE